MTNDQTIKHAFSDFVTPSTFKNPALYQAWKDYESFIPHARFSDAGLDASQQQGMTVDEVNEEFQASVPAQHQAFESREESLKYIYTSKEKMPKSDNPYMASIYLHFFDRRLMYAEIRIQVDSDLDKDFISNDVKNHLIQSQATIEDFVGVQAQTFGLAQMYMQGDMSYELFVPYINADGVESAEFFMFRDGKVRLGYTSSLADEFQSQQNNLLRNLLAFDQQLRRDLADEELSDQVTHLTHPFDDYVTANTVENPATRLAFQYYKTIYHQFPLAEFNLSDLAGCRIDELANQFGGQKDPVHIVTSDREEYLIYLFESDQTNPSTGKNRQAELKLYFYDKILVYADIFGLDSYFFEAELLNFEEMLKELPKGTHLDKFIDLEPITMGLGEFKYQGEEHTILLTPQMTNQQVMKMVNYVFIDDVMQHAFAIDYEDIKDNLRNAMTQTFMNLTKDEL